MVDEDHVELLGGAILKVVHGWGLMQGDCCTAAPVHQELTEAWPVTQVWWRTCRGACMDLLPFDRQAVLRLMLPLGAGLVHAVWQLLLS